MGMEFCWRWTAAPVDRAMRRLWLAPAKDELQPHGPGGEVGERAGVRALRRWCSPLLGFTSESIFPLSRLLLTFGSGTEK